MKRLYSTIEKTAILLLCLAALVSCAGLTQDEKDQVVHTAIDLASVYAASGDYTDAVRVYDQALETTRDYRLIYNKALTLFAAGEHEQARQICVEGFEEFPHIIRFKTALIYMSESETERAQAIEQVLEMNPLDTALRQELVRIYTGLSETEKAAGHALVLWYSGIRDVETVTALYNANAQEWEAVYNMLVPEPDIIIQEEL